MTTPTIAKEIVYDRESREYAIYITIDEQREYIGSSKTYHEGEIKANDYAYHYYTDNHTPEAAARIAVEEFSPEPPSQHTPGPWRANNLLIEIANGMAAEVATIRSVGVGCAPRSIEQAKANARLIAAAPELLNALQGLYKLVDEYIETSTRDGEPVYISYSDLEQARAVIAKASPGGT